MTARFDIRPADPASPAIRPLLEAHLTHTSHTSTPEACHALDLAGLQAADIRFYAAYDGDVAVGCGALKDLGAGRMEVKSVHVASAARGRGIARALMQRLHEVAAHSGAQVLLLETGSDQLPPFDAARALYERLGYRYCAPFGNYKAHPESAFMRYDLAD
jgi:putative acetyltransferase